MEETKKHKIGELSISNASQYSLSEKWNVIRYLDTGSITNNQIDNLQIINIGRDELPSRARRKVKPRDIIYSTVRPNQKHFGFIDIPVENMLVSTGFTVLSVNERLADSKYIYYWLSQQRIIDYLHAVGEQAVSAYPSIKAKDIEDLEIDLPTLSEQKVISSLLTSIDSKIELNRQINDNLEQQAQALFKSWFVDFEPFKDGKFVDSELGMIPEGWKVKSLKEFIYISKSTINPQKNLDKVFIHYSLPACDNGLQPETQLGSEIKSNKIILEDDTILFSKLNPRIKRIWFTSLVKQNSICSTEFIPFKAINNRQYSFVYSVINSDLFYNYILGFVNGATGSHQRFHAEDSLELNIPFNNAIIDEFCKYMEPILEKTTTVRHEISRLIESRDLLLPKLMSGELKINEINN